MACWPWRAPISTWLEARFASIRPDAIAALTRQFRDIDLAEDAFAEACVRALRAWPAGGVPRDPYAWLLTAARNAGIDQLRKAARARPDPDPSEPLVGDYESAQIGHLDQQGLRDDVLRLLFICCHPALARHDQLALALKIVSGLGIPEIARAFLVKPKTMEQRITRAKRTVAQNPVPFEPPDMAERGRRLTEVSMMIYILFNEGWSTSASQTQIRMPLCAEAIRLARLLVDLFPGMAEQMSLLALLLFQHSRRDARIEDTGDLVPIDAQDRSRWDRAMIAEAAFLVQKAARHQPAGPLQLQAAIASEQALAPAEEQVDWPRLVRLYAALYALQPTPVVRLNQAAAIAKTDGPDAALAMIEPLGQALSGYRWFHTTRAAFLLDLGRPAEALASYRAALDLGPTQPERRVLEEKIAECEKNPAPLSDPAGVERPCYMRPAERAQNEGDKQ